MTDPLIPLLAAAFDARGALFRQLEAEDTNAYRLFHGDAEGRAGLAIDRYGDLLLVQCFHSPLSAAALDALAAFYAERLPGLALVFNDRSHANGRIGNPLSGEQLEAAMLPREVRELGVGYRIQGRHAGQDPWLALELRAVRRRLRQEAEGKSVLNLFADTCAAGIVAAQAGARFVMNVDPADTKLAVGKDNARLNALRETGKVRPRFIKSDVFAAARQLSGIGQPERVRGKRMPPFPLLEPQAFDLVVLDPPRHAKSPFGIVDAVHDYASIFKPALLCVAEGGSLLCTHRAAEVARETWQDQLQRSAAKAGRPVRELEWIEPEADFPAADGKPALKIALLRV